MDTILQGIRYLLVGGLVTLADLVIYNFLTGQKCLPRIRANVLSTTVGMALGFSLHLALVFHPLEAQVPARLAKYVATVGLSVYGVQNLVICLLAQLWRVPVRLAQALARRWDGPGLLADDFVDRMVGKIAATGAGMAWNFFWFKYYVYA